MSQRHRTQNMIDQEIAMCTDRILYAEEQLRAYTSKLKGNI
jgi:hypothetical protein